MLEKSPIILFTLASTHTVTKIVFKTINPTVYHSGIKMPRCIVIKFDIHTCMYMQQGIYTITAILY